MTAASEAQNGGVTFSQTRPTLVGSRQMLERFQVRTCTGAPVSAMSRAASVSTAQSRSTLVATGLGVVEAVRMSQQRVVGPGTEG